ncbi:MAG: KH domain-containing protein [Ignavibacteria bacterium]
MKEFIEFIAKNLVDDPDNVRVVETVEENKITLVLHVSKSDLGKVIGKQGKTAKSMRTLLTAVSAKHNKSGHLEIDEGRSPAPGNGNEAPAV